MSRQQLLEFPPNQTLAQLQTLLNDRIRDLDSILLTLMSNPADADLDMANFLIHNLADPVGDLDAVNLRTLKRFGGSGVAPASAPVAAGPQAYTIVFSKDGGVADGELAPDFVVGSNRDGTAQQCWLRAKVPPSTGPMSVNFTVNGVLLLAAPLALAIGNVGPVFSSGFAASGIPLDAIVTPVFTTAGAAKLVSAGVVVGRT